MRATLKSAWWAAPCVVLPALLAIPALMGQALLFRDVLHFNLPQQMFAAAARAAGRLPLWDPGRYGGAPFFAEPGTGVLYPPNFLFHLLAPAAAATWFVLLHLPVAGGGAYLLARRLGLVPQAAALAGCGYAASGYLLSMHGGHYYFASAALLPLLCALLLRARDGRSAALAGVICALAVFNGEFQALFFAGIVALVLAVCAPSDRMRGAAWVLVSLLLGAGLGALQLVPTAMFARETVRGAGLSLAEAGLWPLHPLRWIELLLPAPFGLPWPENGYWGSVLVSGAHHLPWAVSIFLGPALVVPTLLTGWPADARRRALLMIALAALVLAAGPLLKVFMVWVRVVPLADRFRYPEKYALPATLALCLLGAWKAQELSPRAATAAFAAAAALLAAGASLAWAQPHWLASAIGRGLVEAEANLSQADAAGTLVASLVHTAALCAALAAAAMAARSRPAALLPFLLVATIAAQGAHGLRALSWGNASFLSREPAFLAPWRAALLPGSTGRVLNDGSCGFAGGGSGSLLERVRAFHWDTGKENFPLLFGLREALGYGAAENPRQLALVHALRPSGLEATARAIGAAAILGCSDGKVRVRPVPSAIARVRVDGDGSRAQLVEDLPERARISAQGPGLLVLADAAAPGWSVRVDGVPVEIHTTAELFRAVELPPGRREAIFEYSAPGLRAGAIISGLALVLCAVLVAAGSWRRRI